MKLPAVLLMLASAGIPLQARAAQIPAIEPVYGVIAGPAGVTVRVPSNGCTKKADLTVAVSTNPPRPLILIARKRPDTCQSFAAGRAEITYAYAELGLKPGQPFSFANPLVADPTPGAAARDDRVCQKLEVVAVVPPAQAGARVLGPQGVLDIDARPLVASSEVVSAEAGYEGGENLVRFGLTPQASARLAVWTGSHKGGRIVILLDGRVIRVTEIGGPIGGQGLQISGLDRPQAVAMASGVGQCGG
jgi:hypothetical protein